MSAYSEYRKDLIAGFWEYQKQQFPDWKRYFERPFNGDVRPPVFLKSTADFNVITLLDLSDSKKKELMEEIPVNERHCWFRSMTSSQALAQSIFGNLNVHGRLDYLSKLPDDYGEPVLGPARLTPEYLRMEYSVRHLGEPRPSTLDVFVSGGYQVAIECKFAEREIGSCSRTQLRKEDSKYCDGSYTCQKGRTERCSLTKAKVKYWDFIPELFAWRNDIDHRPCPLHRNYQLVRNLLAVCVRPGGKISPENGHVVLIYDDRNPEFQIGGKGLAAFDDTRRALRVPSLLRKCSWQRIAELLRSKNDLSWLTDQVELKYGL